MMLTTLHTTNSWISCLILYKTAPALFPSVAETEGKRTKLLSYFIPLSVLFVIGVVCSNYAYIYCSVAFLQFMKQTNVVWVLILSCLAGSQVLDRMKLAMVTVIMCGTMMAVHGEMHFVMRGFMIQALSQFGECGRNVMQEWVLSGSDVKLDPLTYNLFMAPLSLAVLIVGNLLSWGSTEAAMGRLLLWWHYLLPNAMCAFALNVTISTLIKNTSAMTFILCGVVKDILIVVSSAYIFGDSLAHLQVVGFSLTTSGIFFWSLAKLRPDHPAVQALAKFLGTPKEKKAEEKENAKHAEMKPLLGEDEAVDEEDI